jgi:hypothetical protein
MNLQEIRILFNTCYKKKKKIKEDIIFWQMKDNLEVIKLSIIFDFLCDVQKEILKKCFFSISNLEELKFAQNFSKEIGFNISSEDVFNYDNRYYIFDDICGSTLKRFCGERIEINLKKDEFENFFIE